jgi:Uroporphyrinogen decarboxylase (URO-D)
VAEMSRRERLLAVLEGRVTDRVPVMSGHFNEWADDWKAAEPSYARLVAFCREHCDGILSWAPRPTNETAPGTSSSEASVQEETHPLPEGGTEIVRAVHTPAGTLAQRSRRLPGAATVWTVEPLCKGIEDAERLLSVPQERVAFDNTGFEEADRRIGDAGLVLGETADALCLAAAQFDSADYCVLAFTEPELFKRLLDRFHAMIMDRLDAMLAAGPIKLIRIYGPEYAVPPFMPPAQFDKLVVPYVTEMVDRIHAAGAFVRIHSHGRVRDALPKFVAMGADATDPVEPPPMGDVTLEEAKRITEGRLTLFGNLEFRDLETLSRDEVVDLTRCTLAEGMPGGRFALQPTAEPITIPLNPKLEENWVAYIETALEHGRY